MKRWKSSVINVGKVYAGKKVKIIFQAIEELPEVLFVHTPCSCSSGVYSMEDNTVTVTYKPEAIPLHLQHITKFVDIRKSVTLHYANGTKDILTFKAQVYSKK